ncbi:hypothetical protein Hypma_004267 [Hypsizygus marmoreus]|uniref:Uncharacterized protein n=1 Tax=Hypsizygus marmoreus TaxID=39966 RepID=A0A369J736_HYPMA|nr:hypothetical protein Hypma_004267 [Hypsizygus marmoreus]
MNQRIQYQARIPATESSGNHTKALTQRASSKPKRLLHRPPAYNIDFVLFKCPVHFHLASDIPEDHQESQAFHGYRHASPIPLPRDKWETGREERRTCSKRPFRKCHARAYLAYRLSGGGLNADEAFSRAAMGDQYNGR